MKLQKHLSVSDDHRRPGGYGHALMEGFSVRALMQSVQGPMHGKSVGAQNAPVRVVCSLERECQIRCPRHLAEVQNYEVHRQ
ncbi:hypothetical protein TNCV_4685021 [Trichonephila clavipes]|nr:hypothetical protein TNCV_4685021 [Trichonephila clavipes]